MAPMFPRSVLDREALTVLCSVVKHAGSGQSAKEVQRETQDVVVKKNHDKKKGRGRYKKITSLTSSYGITGGNNSKKVSYGSVHSNNRQVQYCRASVRYQYISTSNLSKMLLSDWLRYSPSISTHRSHVVARLFSNRSQMTSNVVRTKNCHKGAAECITDVLTIF